MDRCSQSQTPAELMSRVVGTRERERDDISYIHTYIYARMKFLTRCIVESEARYMLLYQCNT